MKNGDPGDIYFGPSSYYLSVMCRGGGNVRAEGICHPSAALATKLQS